MAEPTVALIVAGSGETSAKEVFDLLEDYVTPFKEFDLIVPVDKNNFTKAVQHAVEWFDDDSAVVPIRVAKAALSRASSRLGDGETEDVDTFEEIFDDEFDGFDEVHFIVALPETSAEDYDDHAAWVEAAAASPAKIIIRNLCRGLDDVVLEDEEDVTPEPEPVVEPEPEPEPPKRRARASRRKTEEKEPEPIVEADPDPEVEVEATPEPKKDLDEPVAPAFNKDGVAKALGDLAQTVAYLETQEHAYRLFMLQDGDTPDRPIVGNTRKAFNTLAEALSPLLAGSQPSSGPKASATAAKPSRGRGRPRTNFDVKQIFDEDKEEWVARPKGRVAKGTKTRTLHLETDDVLEEGVV